MGQVDASWFLLLILWFCVSGRLSDDKYLEIFSFILFDVVNLKGKNHQECVKTEVVCFLKTFPFGSARSLSFLSAG